MTIATTAVPSRTGLRFSAAAVAPARGKSARKSAQPGLRGEGVRAARRGRRRDRRRGPALWCVPSRLPGVAMKLLRLVRPGVNLAIAIFLVWVLLTGLLVEDNGAYLERARDWSRSARGALR
jgi:hypothetical protein